MSAVRGSTSFHCAGRALLVAAGLLLAAQVAAAEPGKSADAQAVYQRDRIACLSGASNQERATCLREAGAARQAANAGRLDANTAQTGYPANRLRRCANLPAQDREDCIRRMNGEGTTSGSVQGGGIYRELATPVEAAKRD